MSLLSFASISKTERIEITLSFTSFNKCVKDKTAITPAYYDVTLTGKYFRDEESRAMLDILYSTRTYDLGLLYQVGEYTQTFLDMVNNLKSDFISTHEKSESAALNQIDKINDTFSQNN